MVKTFKLGDNIWHFKGHYVHRIYYPDNTHRFYVYNKFKNGKCQDYCYSVPNLAQLHNILSLFSEAIDTPIVDWCIPDKFPE